MTKQRCAYLIHLTRLLLAELVQGRSASARVVKSDAVTALLAIDSCRLTSSCTYQRIIFNAGMIEPALCSYPDHRNSLQPARTPS